VKETVSFAENYLMMKQLLLVISTLFIFGLTQAQTDSTEVSDVKVIDIVRLKDGTTLRGEILVFEEKDGDITFKSLDGKTYFLTKEEYLYFEEDQVFEKKKKKAFELRERKDGELEFSIGLTAGFIDLTSAITPDELYNLDSEVYGSDSPISLKVSGGKYLDRKNFIGLYGELGLITESSGYFSAGVRYLHQYDGYKKNAAFYIPIELGYNQWTTSPWYTLSDTLFYEDGGWSYPTYEEIKTDYSSVNFSFGQGVAFILPQKKSLALELALVKNFVLSETFTNSERRQPISEPSITGIRFSLLYNL